MKYSACRNCNFKDIKGDICNRCYSLLDEIQPHKKVKQ